MHSTDKVWAIFWISLFTAAIAIALMVTYETVINAPLNTPVEVMRVKSEHIQRMVCIQNKGEWVHKSDAGNSCSYKQNS